MGNNTAKRPESLDLPMSVPFHMLTYQHANLFQLEHSHVFFELGYLREGRIMHSFADKSVYAEKGDYFIIDIGDIHSYKAVKNEDVLVMQNCMFLPSVIDNSIKKCRRFKEMIVSHPLNVEWKLLDGNPTSTIFHDETGEIGMMMDILDREYKKETCHPQVLKGILSTILITTMQKIMTADSKGVSGIVNTILQYASEHYFEDDVLTSLSREIHYSLPYLSSVFKKQTGGTFKEYLQKLRIDEACKLLISSNYKIYHIGNIVGYKSETQFHKTFMELIGTTPKKYREEMRNMGIY